MWRARPSALLVGVRPPFRRMLGSLCAPAAHGITSPVGYANALSLAQIFRRLRSSSIVLGRVFQPELAHLDRGNGLSSEPMT